MGALTETVSGLLWTINADDDAVARARMVAEIARFQRVERLLDGLHREVLARRYGLGCDRETANEVAHALGVSAKAVTTAEKRAVALLLNAFGAVQNEGMPNSEFRPPGAESSTGRALDMQSALVADWKGGCLMCEDDVVNKPLSESDGQLTMPLCKRHRRWAMACRRERMGKQSHHFKRLLIAWVKASGQDLEVARAWLGY